MATSLSAGEAAGARPFCVAAGATGEFVDHLTFGPANANYLAQAQIYNRLQGQANLLAYVDVYYVLCALSLLMVPLSLLLRRNNPKESSKHMVAVH